MAARLPEKREETKMSNAIRGQAVNPYLPSYEYIPDGEPYIFGDRLYVYGSHDLFNGLSFCLGDYVCYSAPLSDLSDWRFEGMTFRREQDPSAWGPRVKNGMAAPDMVQGPDGRYYLYYFIGGTQKISVAVCDTPAGEFEFYGDVHYDDGVPIGKKGEPFQFDPGVLLDDDGRLYLYTGFALTTNPLLTGKNKPTLHGPMCYELDPSDMLTVKKGPGYIGVGGLDLGKNSEYGSHLFLEASSMRKFEGKYYFIYSSQLSHELCYAVSDHPTGGFHFGGILVSNGDIGLPGIGNTKHARNDTGNTHGSVIKIGEDYYVFYHRHTNRKQSSRQACAEKIRFENGKFYQAEMTSCGLNNGPLRGEGTYPTYIACNVYGRSGTRFLSMIKRPKGDGPYLTQDGGDRESGGPQYIANFCPGCTVGFKFFDLTNTRKVSVKLFGTGRGQVTIRTREDGSVVARIPVRSCPDGEEFTGELPKLSSHEALFFGMEGSGSFEFRSFTLIR